MHKITPGLENLLTIDYEIKESQFFDYDINDPFANNFILTLQKCTFNCQENLSESCFDKLLIIIAEHVTLRIEKFILQKKFSFVS